MMRNEVILGTTAGIKYAYYIKVHFLNQTYITQYIIIIHNIAIRISLNIIFYGNKI